MSKTSGLAFLASVNAKKAGNAVKVARICWANQGETVTRLLSFPKFYLKFIHQQDYSIIREKLDFRSECVSKDTCGGYFS